MDAATLKVAKNYTNEQAAQKATNSPVEEISFDGGIYSVGNNVVNGQVSDVKIKGRSLKNELNYNPETWAGWAVGESVSKLASGLEFTFVDSEYNLKTSAYISTKVKPSTKYGLLLNCVFNNASTKSLWTFTDICPAFLVVGSGVTGNVKKTFTTNASISTNRFLLMQSSNGEAGAKIKIADIRIFELPSGSEIEADFTNLTADQLAQKYPYVNGDSTKSTNSVRLKSVGKNLFDKTDTEILSGKVFTAEGGVVNDTTRFISNFIPVLDNTPYAKKNMGNTVVFYNSRCNKISMSLNNPYFVTPANTKYVRFNALISQLDTVQLEKSTTSTEYEPYKESSAIINLPEPLRSLPNGVKDEYSVGQDGTKKTQKNKEYVLQASDVVSVLTRTSFVQAVIPFSKFPLAPVAGADAIQGTFRLDGWNEIIFTASGDYVPNVFATRSTNELVFNFPLGTTLAQAQTALAGLAVTYQLATPIVTKLPAQAPLQVFENGTVYVEPIGDPSETTLPSVEMTIPTGNSNKFGVASHDYDGAAADWTLTNSESKCFLLAVSNAGGAANIIAPDAPGVMYAISNASGYAITIKKSGGAGVVVTNAKTVLVIHNGTDYTALTAEL